MRGEPGVLLQSLRRDGKEASSESTGLSDFRERHFAGEIVLSAVPVRWYCRYGISYGDFAQMMGERGVSVVSE